MKADGSRIAIFNFDTQPNGVAPIIDENDGAGSCAPCLPPCWRTVEEGAATAAPDANAATLQFDVRHAKCTLETDEEKLLSAIETCGGGFDVFNTWMSTIVEAARQREASPMRGGRRGSLGHGRVLLSAALRPTGPTTIAIAAV